MSKRGSKNSKFIGGVSWKPVKFKQGKPGKKDIKNENTKVNQFETIRKAFDLEGDDPEYRKYLKVFLEINNKKMRQKAIDNIEDFKSKAELDVRPFSIATYFNFQYHLK
ncbi:hypothetical protein N9K15_02110 [Maribacter arcticus]|nr:hypothetical protein [Maribacter arcticus]MDA9089717.1 hypothetical protein [Maribacter arcticus]